MAASPNSNGGGGGVGSVVVVEETFLLVKPDASAYHREVLAAISDAGLQIAVRSLRGLTRRQAEMVVSQYPYIQSMFHKEHIGRLERDGEATAGEFTARLRNGSSFSGGSVTYSPHSASGGRRPSYAPNTNTESVPSNNNSSNYQQFAGHGPVAVGDLGDSKSPTSAFYRQRVRVVGEADGAPSLSKAAAHALTRDLPTTTIATTPSSSTQQQHSPRPPTSSSPRVMSSPANNNSIAFRNSTAGGAGIVTTSAASPGGGGNNGGGGGGGLDFDSLPDADDRDAVPFSQPRRVDLYSPYHGTYHGANATMTVANRGGPRGGGNSSGTAPAAVVGSSSSTGGILYNTSMDASLLFSMSLQQQQQRGRGGGEGSPLGDNNAYATTRQTNSGNGSSGGGLGGGGDRSNSSGNINASYNNGAGNGVLIGESLMSAWLRSPARHRLTSANAGLLPSFPHASPPMNASSSRKLGEEEYGFRPTHHHHQNFAASLGGGGGSPFPFSTSSFDNTGAVLTTAPPTTNARLFVPKGPSPSLKIALAKGQWSPAEIAFETAVDYLVAGGTCLALAISGVRAISRVAELTFGFSNNTSSGGNGASSVHFQNQQQHALWTREACRSAAPYSLRSLYAAGAKSAQGSSGGGKGIVVSTSNSSTSYNYSPRQPQSASPYSSPRRTVRGDAASSSSSPSASNSNGGGVGSAEEMLYNGFFCPLRFSDAASLIRTVFGYETSQRSELLPTNTNNNSSSSGGRGRRGKRGGGGGEGDAASLDLLQRVRGAGATASSRGKSAGGLVESGGGGLRPMLDVLDVDDDQYMSKLLRRFNAEAEALRRSAGGALHPATPPRGGGFPPATTRKRIGGGGGGNTADSSSSSASSEDEDDNDDHSSSDDDSSEDDDGMGSRRRHRRRGRRRDADKGHSRPFHANPLPFGSAGSSSTPYRSGGVGGFGGGGERSRLSATSDSREQALHRQQQVLNQMVSVLAEERRSIQLETRKLRVNELELLLREQRMATTTAANPQNAQYSGSIPRQ